MSFQTPHQITHAFSGSSLAKNHTEHLDPTGERLNIFVAIVCFNESVEHPAGRKICKLSEDILTKIHGILLFAKLKTMLKIQIVTLKKRYNCYVQRVSKNEV